MFVSGCFSDMLPLGPVGKQVPRKGFFAVLADFTISWLHDFKECGVPD